MKLAIRWRARWKIDKFALGVDPRALRSRPFGVSRFEGNCLLYEGINEIFSALAGDPSGPIFSHDNAHLGVGDSLTPALPEQTGLQAAVNRCYMPMEVSYPIYGADQLMIFRAIFGPDDANYDWNEFTVSNGVSGGGYVNLNREVNARGTKTIGLSWTLTLTVDLA